MKQRRCERLTRFESLRRQQSPKQARLTILQIHLQHEGAGREFRRHTSKKIPARTCIPAEAAAVEARLSALQSNPKILIVLKPEAFAVLAKVFHFWV